MVILMSPAWEYHKDTLNHRSVCQSATNLRLGESWTQTTGSAPSTIEYCSYVDGWNGSESNERSISESE